MNPKYCIFLFSILFYSLIHFDTYAQTTGKIAGTVIDKETGLPLPGVNVYVANSLLGGSTDLDGFYIILNVPPGKHEIKFEYIGYNPVVVKNVIVNIDRTTNIDISMNVVTLELEEAVTVTAERPIIENDKTYSSVHLSSEDVKTLPVEGVRNIMELSPGIIKNPDGTLSIRGGGSYEINFSVNGIKSINTNTGIPAYGVASKSENSWKYDVNPLAISQMEVISGGFNAEYGNAQSGVVNMVAKEGGQKFSGGFIFEYRPPGQYHWGDYLYSKNQPEWRNWNNINKWYPFFQLKDSTGNVIGIDSVTAMRNFELWQINHTPAEDNILGVYDYRKSAYSRYLFSFGGPLGRDAQKFSFFLAGELKYKPTRLPTREKIQNLQNYSLILSYKPSGKHNFKMTGLYQYFYSGMGSGSDDIRWSGLWSSYGARRKYTLIYDAPREETVFAQNLNYKYIISPTSYLETTFTHQNERLYALQTPVPGLEKDKQIHPNINDRQLEEDGGPWNMEYRKYFTWSTLYNQASLTDYYELKSNYSTQITNTNLFKAGIEAWLMDQDYNASSSLTVSAFIWRTGFATNYKAKTWYTAGYIQDKLEFAGMVANLGLRFDAYNFGVDVPADPYAIFYPAQPSDTSNVGLPLWKKSDTFTSFSPRLGISFPIAERTAFRLMYGHFRSMPINNRALDNQTYNGWASYGNANLEPKLSVNYEVGLQQNLWDTHQLDIVTYYNDLKNQIGTIYVKSFSGSRTRSGDFIQGEYDLEDLKSSYISYDNNGYGHSRGLEITFRNRDSETFKYFFSYALSQTTYGHYGTQIIGIDPETGEEISDELKQKYQYQASDFIAAQDRTHKFNSSLTYYIPDNHGPKIFNFFPLSNTSFSLIYKINSGLAYYYSPEFQSNLRVESNRRYPIESQTDLRIEKNIEAGDFNIKLGLRVLNLFDNKHFTPIGREEELERWVQRGVSYLDKDYDAYGNEIPASERGETIYNYFQTYKNIPRQVFISLGVTF